MLKVKEVVSYKIESLVGVSVPEALGLAILTGEGDVDALFAIADIAHAWKQQFSDGGRSMQLKSEAEGEPVIHMIILSGGESVRLMVEKTDDCGELAVLASGVWTSRELVDMLEIEV